MRVLNSTVALFFQILTIAFCVLILSSCGSGNTTSPANGSPTNNPPASVAFATKVFQTADKSDSIRFISSTEIEFTEHKTNVVGAYTRQDNKIRAVFDGLGTKRALYFVETEDGLTAEDDGKKYLSETAFRKLEEELKKRLETHAALKAYRTALDKKDYDTAWSELQKYGTDNKYITDKIDLLFTKRDSLAANALAKDTFEKYKDDGVRRRKKISATCMIVSCRYLDSEYCDGHSTAL